MRVLNDRAVDAKTKYEIKKHDKLGLADYAEALSQFIKDCETPITIGIQGDWGIGKSSLLNMIDKNLSEDCFKKIWFNTWHFSLFDQDRYLGIAVIRALLDEIAKQFNVKENNGFRSAKKILLDVAKEIQIQGIPVGKMINGAIGKDQQENEINIAMQMLRFKKEFERLITEILKIDDNGNSETKVVFFIDDIDRVKPAKALELLESLKNFLDVEGCVFVLAIDYEIVQIGMAQKLGRDLQKTSGKSFFDKIIQLPFLMPTTNYQLGDYIGHLLSESGFLGKKGNRYKPLKDELKQFYEDITSVTVGRNPRSIKRVVNYAKLLDLIRFKNSKKKFAATVSYELQRQILYALICMQIAWPELFKYFSKRPTPETIKNLENWEFLDTLSEAKKLFARVPDEEVVKNNISSYFDILFDLLDKDNSGDLDRNEMKPVRLMLELAKLTSVEDIDEPIEIFLQKVRNNDAEENYRRFLKNVFLKSKWKNDSGIDYRLTGNRYVTILVNRKQVGSLVTLQKSPFVFRLAIDDKFITETLQKENWNGFDIPAIIKPLEYVSLSGFGDTVIDIDEILNTDEHLAIKFLNSIYAVLAERGAR